MTSHPVRTANANAARAAASRASRLAPGRSAAQAAATHASAVNPRTDAAASRCHGFSPIERSDSGKATARSPRRARAARPGGGSPCRRPVKRNGTTSARKNAQTLKKSQGDAKGPTSRPQLRGGAVKWAQKGRARRTATAAVPATGSATPRRNPPNDAAAPPGRATTYAASGTKTSAQAYVGTAHPFVTWIAAKRRPRRPIVAASARGEGGASRVARVRRSARNAVVYGIARTCAWRSAKRKDQSGYSLIPLG